MVGFRSDLKTTENQMRRTPSRLAALAGVEVAEIESLNTPLSCTVQAATGSSNPTHQPTAAPTPTPTPSLTATTPSPTRPSPPTPSPTTQSPTPVPRASATVWREGLVIVNGSGAEALWSYDDDFFGTLGYHAVTRLQTPQGGDVVYVGTGIEAGALIPLAKQILDRKAIPWLAELENDECEQLLRTDLDGTPRKVVINHSGGSVQVAGWALPAYGVNITSITSMQA